MAMPIWQKGYENAYELSYINSDEYDPAADFYANYYSDYSYQENMKDPITGVVFQCRYEPLKCYDLARLPKKLTTNPTKTTSTIFASVAVTTTSTFQWTSSRKPSIEISWVSYHKKHFCILVFKVKTYFLSF